MTSAVVARAPSDYRALAEQVRAVALLERRPWHYGVRIALTVAAFAAGWAALFVVRDSWAALAIAPFQAFACTQLLFLGHDAGHQQIFALRRRNRTFGLVTGNLLSGLSFGWWVPKHNAHHAYPNQIGRDPDIGPGSDPLDTANAGPQGQSWSRLRLTRRIAVSVPLVLLELGMHLTSGRHLARRRDRGAVGEWLLIGMHAVLYLGVLFWLLSPLQAVAFIVLQQALFGVYLRVSFAPNHKGMPIIEHDAKVGFVQRQVLTSRNVTGGWLVTFMLGGLNYQIEHHLFPSMPRPNLRKAQAIVRTFCADNGLSYREDNLADSYRQAFRSLRRSAVAPRLEAPVPG